MSQSQYHRIAIWEGLRNGSSTFKIILFILCQLFFLDSFAIKSEEIKNFEKKLQVTTDIEERIELLYGSSRKFAVVNLEYALELATEGLRLSEENKDAKFKANFNLLLGKINLEIGQKEPALKNFENAILISNEKNLSKIEAESTIMLGYYWYRLGDSTRTITNYSKALELYEEMEDKNGMAQSYLKLGWGHDIYGNYELAEKYFLKAMETGSELEDTTLMINSLTGIGSYYANKSINQHQAIIYYEKARNLAQQQGNKNLVGRTCNALGNLYSSLGNTEMARSFYMQSLDIFKASNNQIELCWLYTQIGGLHSVVNEYELALEYLNMALSIVDKTDNVDMQKGEIYLAIGVVYQKKDKDYDKAIEYFEKSLALAKRTNNNFQILNAELSIGVCQVAMGNNEEGKKNCLKALNKGESQLAISHRACECLFNATQNMGDFKSALVYHEKFKLLTDSLHREELSEKINSLGVKQAYEMELAKIQKAKDLEASNIRVNSVKTIAGISMLALAVIMFLVISIIRKNSQRKEMQALSMARKELIANVSHDLRTPLTAMNGYAETLLMRLGKTKIPDQEKYLNIILNSANRLSQLVEQLFEYSKLEAKQIEPVKEFFDIHELTEMVTSRYTIIAEEKDIEIVTKYDETLPNVYADPILIERVIQNLIDNALKFTKPKGVLTLVLSKQSEDVQIKISDTGKGIPTEKKELIFNRYQKSLNSNGAGLGLTIVKDILDMHGSSIHVESELNKGTCFIFSLPSSKD